MKKVLALVSMLALAGSAIGQGTINFYNAGAEVTTAAGDLAGSSYWGQIFGGPENSTADSLTPMGTPVNFLDNAGVGTGIIFAGEVTITGIPAGGAAAVQLRAWSAASGSSWDEAIANPAGEIGSSNVNASHPTGDPTASPPGTPVNLAGINPFQLQAVPEPSTWALLALGVGALALRRRK
jgi:hypothetical protein